MERRAEPISVRLAEMRRQSKRTIERAQKTLSRTDAALIEADRTLVRARKTLKATEPRARAGRDGESALA